MKNNQGTYDSQAAKEISLNSVLRIMRDLEVSEIYVKKLSPNDNSKNQPYLGGHLVDLPFIPTGEIVASESNSKKTSDPKRKIKYMAPLNWFWLGADGRTYVAPNAKLIYYPQYPEVRLSGFLSGSKAQASKWMLPDKQGRCTGRWLIFGVANKKTIYAYLVTPESNLSRELARTDFIEVSKVIWQLSLSDRVPKKSTRDTLVDKLLEIHQKGWVQSQKLGANMMPKPYKARNGGGYTLEALLGISPNGIAEPDYLGWEVKQFSVTSFPKTGARPTTLMTPEPNGGFYKSVGVVDFVKTYGYSAKDGTLDRINFGGKHIVGQLQRSTELTMELTGYDVKTSSITDASGAIELLDKRGNVAASWSYAKLMNHWKTKHSQAVYIPCMRREKSGIYEYFYGKDIELGNGTTFEMMLNAMHLGSVYYDPGIKLEHASGDRPELKRRSQFRVSHKHLKNLYKKYEFLDVTL